MIRMRVVLNPRDLGSANIHLEIDLSAYLSISSIEYTASESSVGDRPCSISHHQNLTFHMTTARRLSLLDFLNLAYKDKKE